jgi:hypothetical protein
MAGVEDDFDAGVVARRPGLAGPGLAEHGRGDAVAVAVDADMADAERGSSAGEVSESGLARVLLIGPVSLS